MITYSTIQKSQLEGSSRLDAEYYQPEYLERKNKIANSRNSMLLKNIAVIKTGPAYSSEKIGENFEIPLARIGDVTNKNEIENWLKLSKNEFEKFHNNKINDGDILMTMTGDPPDVGKVNLIAKRENSVLAFNQRVAKLNSKSKNISNKFLFAYLSTEYSRFQAERAALGIRQRNLGIEDLRNILIVLPEERRNIEKLIEIYQVKLESSRKFYRQAENLLLEELGLEDFKIEDNLSSIVNFSKVKKANRIDAEYFQPKYEKLLSKIKNKKLLGDLVLMQKGFEPGSGKYQEEGKLFIRVSSMSKNGINDKDQKYLSEDLYKKLKNDFEPKVGEILLTKDATPGIAYVVKEPTEGIISSGILKLKTEEKIDQEYLALCINSIIGKLQAERDAGGSVITHWKPEQIKNIAIPILPKKTQQDIADLVKKSHKSRKRTKELLEEAKQKVENLIEE